MSLRVDEQNPWCLVLGFRVLMTSKSAEMPERESSRPFSSPLRKRATHVGTIYSCVHNSFPPFGKVAYGLSYPLTPTKIRFIHP